MLLLFQTPVHADIAIPQPTYAAEELPPPRLPPFHKPYALYSIPFAILIAFGIVLWTRKNRSIKVSGIQE
jgi:hypothetical protein